MSRLIMLDFDGVIADSLEATTAATIQAMEEGGFAHLNSPEIVLRVAESNWFEGLQEAGIPLAVSDAVDEIVAKAVAVGEFAPFVGMPDVIAGLAERHCILIVTSNRTDIVEAFLARWSIVGVHEVLGGDKGQSKVSKIRAAARRHAWAEGKWFVGDTIGDIVEGRRAGVGTIAATWGWHTPEQLAGARPDRIAGVPADLLALLL